MTMLAVPLSPARPVAASRADVRLTIRTHARYTLATLATGAVAAVATAVWIAAGWAGDYAVSSLSGELAAGCVALLALQQFARWAAGQRVSQDCTQCHRPFVPTSDSPVCTGCLDRPVAERAS